MKTIKLNVAKSGLCKMVKLVKPEMTLYEQREIVEGAWDRWQKDAPNAQGYDYFATQFIVWFWLLLTADGDRLKELAPRVSQECQPVYWRAWGMIQEAEKESAEAAMDILEKLLNEIIDAQIEFLEPGAEEVVQSLIDDLPVGDTDGDPVPGGGCGNPDCWYCNSFE